MEQSRRPTTLAIIALLLAVYNATQISEARKAREYVVSDLRKQVAAQAVDIKTLTAEVARAQKAVLTIGETLKSKAKLVSALTAE